MFIVTISLEGKPKGRFAGRKMNDFADGVHEWNAAAVPQDSVSTTVNLMPQMRVIRFAADQ
jgi:hypothetical protein